MKDEELLEIILSAKSGDQESEKKLARYIHDQMTTGQEVHPFAINYLAGALLRRSTGCTWNQSFRVLGRQPSGASKPRLEMKKIAIKFWVDRAISEGLKTTNAEGEPGEAFVKVAEACGLAPSTVRDIYYS